MMRNRSIAWFLLAALTVVAGITMVHETIEAHQHLDNNCDFCLSVASWLPGEASPNPAPAVRVEGYLPEAPEAVVAILLTSLLARAPPVSA